VSEREKQRERLPRLTGNTGAIFTSREGFIPAPLGSAVEEGNEGRRERGKKGTREGGKRGEGRRLTTIKQVLCVLFFLLGS
jgi:hypothetical protein